MALFREVANLAEKLAGESSRLKKRSAIAEAIRAVHDGEPQSEDAGRFARSHNKIPPQIVHSPGSDPATSRLPHVDLV